MSFGKRTTAEEVTEGLDLSGRRVLITGFTSRIGRESAREHPDLAGVSWVLRGLCGGDADALAERLWAWSERLATGQTSVESSSRSASGSLGR